MKQLVVRGPEKIRRALKVRAAEVGAGDKKLERGAAHDQRPLGQADR